MNVNFILTSGPLIPSYRRAIESAKVHGAPIVLWHVYETPPDVTGLDVTTYRVKVERALEGKQQAHIYDVLAYRLALLHGGLFLGLDTISLKSAMDLLGEEEVVVSTDWPPDDHAAWPDPYNNNFICRANSNAMAALYAESIRRVVKEPENWGYTGPQLLTGFVKRDLIAAAPYPALCGWAPGYIWRFYLGLERPPEDARVIHLCRTAYLALDERRYADWARQHPFYAGPVRARTNLNDDILKI